MKGPWRALLVQGSPQILHFLWPDPNENNHWLYLCILCRKNGIKGLRGDKSRPSLGPGPALGGADSIVARLDLRFLV